MYNEEDEFANLPDDDEFGSLPDDSYIPKTESFLQRALKPVQAFASQLTPQAPQIEGQNPFMAGINAVRPTGAMNVNMYRGAHEAKQEAVNEITDDPVMRFALDEASNIENYVGIGGAKNAIVGAAKAIRKPSKFFGKGLEKVSEANPKGKVDFLNIIRNASENPEAAKVIRKSKIIEKFGGTKLTDEGTISENLSNLSVKDAQDLITAVKTGVQKATLRGEVAAKDLGISKMLTELSKAQNKAFKGMSGLKRSYGIAKNTGKFVKSYGKKIASGAAWGTGVGAGFTAGKILLNK